MATVKQQSITDLAELIRFTLEPQSNSESLLDLTVIEQNIITVASAVRFERLKAIRLEMLQLYGRNDEFLETYSSTFTDVPILFSQSEDVFYSKLPAKPMKIGEANLGIYFVGFPKQQEKAFINSPNYSPSFYHLTKTREYWTDIGQGGRIYYKQKDYKDNSKVIVRMLADVEERPDTEPFIEKEFEKQVMDLVIQTVTNQRPPDKNNDSNPTP